MNHKIALLLIVCWSTLLHSNYHSVVDGLPIGNPYPSRQPFRRKGFEPDNGYRTVKPGQPYPDRALPSEVAEDDGDFYNDQSSMRPPSQRYTSKKANGDSVVNQMTRSFLGQLSVSISAGKLYFHY